MTRFRQLVDRRVERRPHLVPVRGRRADLRDVEHDRGALASFAALFRDHEVDRHITRRGVQPRVEHGVAREAARLAGEPGKDLLGHIGRGVRIAAGATQRRAVDEIEMAVHQLGEGFLGPLFDETAEQRGVIIHVGSLPNQRRTENRTNTLTRRKTRAVQIEETRRLTPV